MMLLREGTSMLSDFGGIIQKRFTSNTPRIEIRKDLKVAGILPTTRPNCSIESDLALRPAA